MKTVLSTFLKTTKGKVIAATSGVAIGAAIVATIILMNQGFRTIVVDSLNGSSTVTNNGKAAEAVEGQHLQDGDDVRVSPASDLTLFVDQDKYIYAEENAHFWLEAKGKPDDTRTSIKQDAGSVLYRVDNKLNEGEFFNVNSSNASMSIRGTVFRITCDDDSANKYTKIEVFEGSVFVEAKMENGDDTDQSKLLNAGEMAIIRSNDEISEFLEDEEQNVVMLIEYNSLPKGTAKNLGTIIDSGRDVGISKELLFDYVELTEHKFVATDASTDPTHLLAGNLVEVCTICGLEKETEIPPLSENEDEHKIVTETVEGTCDNPGYTITKCADCGEIIEKTVTSEKKEHEFGKYEITKQATEDEEGEKVAVCSDCGEKKVVKIEKLKPVAKASAMPTVTPTPTISANVVAVVKPSPSPTPSVKPVVTPEPEETPTPAPARSSSSSSKDSSSDDSSSNDSSSNDDSSNDPCAEGHDYVLKSTTDSTCSLAGSKVYECSRCKGTKTNTIAKKAHKYNEQTPIRDIAPTCTEPGKAIYQCMNCTATEEREIGPALGHDFSGLITTAGASSHNIKCIRCDSYDTVAHSFTGTATNVDGDYHEIECAACSEKKREQHDFTGAATESAVRDKHTRSCGLCGATKDEAHIFSADVGWDTETSKSHYRSCLDCPAIADEHGCTWKMVKDAAGNDIAHIFSCDVSGCEESYDESKHIISVQRPDCNLCYPQ